MQTQTTAPAVNILDQFSEMLKSHSIVVSDRDNLLKLLENIVDLCTQMPKTKLKAALKAATPKTVAEPKKKPAAAAKKSKAEILVGPADAGDCPVLSDIAKAPRGRGRPRKEVAVASPTQSESSVNEAEKKKRGRPKKDKTIVVSSNEDEDALIAKMMSDMKAMQRDEDAVTPAAVTPAAIPDPAENEDDNSTVSVSPVIALHPEVEADVVVEVKKTTKTATNAKKTKEPKEPKAHKAAKEPKNASKTSKKSKSDSVEPAAAPAAAPTAVAAPAISPAPASAFPPRENKAHSDGNFYLMPNYPRTSFTYNGVTYLRTETDNVYDNLTFELIGVWDHLNHEIITACDEEEETDIWMSDEE
jgi:hypothetical protein